MTSISKCALCGRESTTIFELDIVNKELGGIHSDICKECYRKIQWFMNKIKGVTNG